MVPFERLSQALSGSYAVDRQIGRGGTASVFLARDLKHDREVALKVLDPAIAASVGADRFVLEIRTTARLNHPHIIPLYDSGEADGFLYCVVAYVEGESLRGRLKSEGRLPVAEALRIAAELAGALAYAHAQGFIHRDIKPENVLIGHGGHVYLADFGLARAILEVTDQRLTASGVVPGTPLYVSPEQVSGQADIGPPTDIYSLGCLLHEMLAGDPPFRNPNVQALFAAHIGAEPPPLGHIRPEVPAAVERIVLDTLTKAPSGRPDARELAARLERARVAVPPFPSWRIRRNWERKHLLAGFVVLALLFLAAVVFKPVIAPGTPDLSALDLTQYVVFPFSGDSLQPETAALLASALTRWEGITVVDPRILSNALQRRGGVENDLGQATRVARDLGAGRYVLGSVRGGRFIEATVYDATSSSTSALGVSRMVPGGADEAARQSAINTLADSLLFPGLAAIDGPVRPGGTRSAPALWAYARGHESLGEWRLDAADSAFSTALRADPSYGDAYLWLAQVRGWASDDTAAHGTLARQASSHVDGANVRHSRLAQALVHLAAGQFPEACAIYRSLAELDERDFVAWYGLGECQRRDSRVVPDASSPSGFAFRSSFHAAVEAYERAFQITPAMLAMFSTGSYERLLNRLFWASRTRARTGRGVEGRTFRAFPGWSGDSLVFIPYPANQLPRAEELLRTNARAIGENQERFKRLAAFWVRSQPESAEALEALAIAQAALGEPDALTTFGRARSLASDAVIALRIGAEETWLALRASLPADPARLRQARTTADSLLENTQTWNESGRYMLASLAALASRCDLAGRLMAADPAEDETRQRLSNDAVTDSQRLLAYAALGLGSDSLPALESRIRQRIDRLSAEERIAARRELLWRAALLAFPTHPFQSLPDLGGFSNLLDAEQALANDDPVTASSAVDRELAAAAAILPGLRTLDAVFIEAWILDRLGRQADAMPHLDRALLALEYGNPFLMRDAVQVASLLRAIELRIKLANGAADESTRDRWTRALQAVAPERMARDAAGNADICSS